MQWLRATVVLIKDITDVNEAWYELHCIVQQHSFPRNIVPKQKILVVVETELI
jgi:hypothetical protein